MIDSIEDNGYGQYMDIDIYSPPPPKEIIPPKDKLPGYTSKYDEYLDNCEHMLEFGIIEPGDCSIYDNKIIKNTTNRSSTIFNNPLYFVVSIIAYWISK